MTNQQSEADAVLSSVRRLFSEDDVDEAVDRVTGGVLERLLLTPALRVDAPEPAAPARARRAPSALELRIAELERAVGSQPGEFEPDGGEVDEAPAAAVTPAETISEEQPGTPAVRDRETAAEGRVLLEGVVIDEAGLRAVISEMVRAELQGELGERITRNVRKLVRREIHREMLMRDIR